MNSANIQNPGHALITGGCGFIGSHLVDGLLADGWRVTCIDNFDPYYDAAIKRGNQRPHLDYAGYRFISADIRDGAQIEALEGDFTVIVHLAAKAGVRNSLLDPLGYQMTNIIGTQNLLTLGKTRGIRQFVFASSSSVYGDCPTLPWSEADKTLLPLNPYASTKLAGEQLGYVYARTFGLRFIGLRFFTVIGERQRPDLAIHKFGRLMLKGQKIPVYGDGTSSRDYTYWADIVQGVRGAMAYTGEDWSVFNLGNHRTVTLMEMIGGLEKVLNIRAEFDRLPDQPGEMKQTWADISRSQARLGYRPQTDFHTALERFAPWLHDTLALERAVM
jgi:UDP-glucuronate 4-epimerase